MNETDTIQYNAIRIVVDPSRAPRQVHRFFYTRVGTEMVIDVGYYDTAELRIAIEGVREVGADPGKALDVPFFVTDRFVLSVSAAEDFIRTADFVRADLEKQRAAMLAQLQKVQPE